MVALISVNYQGSFHIHTKLFSEQVKVTRGTFIYINGFSAAMLVSTLRCIFRHFSPLRHSVGPLVMLLLVLFAHIIWSKTRQRLFGSGPQSFNEGDTGHFKLQNGIKIVEKVFFSSVLLNCITHSIIMAPSVCRLFPRTPRCAEQQDTIPIRFTSPLSTE